MALHQLVLKAPLREGTAQLRTPQSTRETWSYLCWEKHLAGNATKIYQGQQSLWLVWSHTSTTDKDAKCWEVHLTQHIFSRHCVNEQDSRSVQPRRTLHGRKGKEGQPSVGHNNDQVTFSSLRCCVVVWLPVPWAPPFSDVTRTCINERVKQHHSVSSEKTVPSKRHFLVGHS